MENGVTNQRLQTILEKNSLEVVKLLKSLTGVELFIAENRGRWTTYKLNTYFKTTLAFDALVDNIREGRTAEDLLFQVLPECNLPLSSKIEIREIHGKKVFVVNDGYLMACFDKDINEAVITAIAKEKPYYFVMCDRSIATDNVADNFDQIFNAYSKETVRRIL